MSSPASDVVLIPSADVTLKAPRVTISASP